MKQRDRLHHYRCFAYYMVVTFLVSLSVFACQPRGEIGPQPDRPKNNEVDAFSLKAKSFARRGLPSFCRSESQNAEFSCIICEVDMNTNKSCFSTYETIDPKKICKFTDRNLKCLIDRGPRLVVLHFDRSSSEQFILEFKSIIKTFLHIVSSNESMSFSGKTGFVQVLSFFEDNLFGVISEKKLIENYGKFFRSRCVESCDFPAAMNKFRSEIIRLREKAKAGTLDTQDGISLIKSVSKDINLDKSVLVFIESISVDGIKDQ